MCKEYNGWTNKPTWLVGLWLGNDNDNHRWFVTRAKRLGRNRLDDLAREIESYVRQGFPPAPSSCLADDMQGWLFATTDWREVASSYLDTAEDYTAHDA
jgi:hypothetical protein